jgi:hypothetical protein
MRSTTIRVIKKDLAKLFRKKLGNLIYSKYWYIYIGCSFKFLPKVGVEESIVNTPLVNTNTKSEVRFKQRICDL